MSKMVYGSGLDGSRQAILCEKLTTISLEQAGSLRQKV